jgi:hypothetical protein
MIEFYDTHAHCIKNQQGGILIALEGNPVFDGTLNNCDVERLTRENPNYFPAYYITKDFNAVPDETILKYHPRREGYSADEVIDDLLKRNCKLCIIDTLNYPNWQPIDYLKVIRSFPDIYFLLPHMGGYDIFEFLKIFDFNKNVFADFSMTQEYFGWCGGRAQLSPVVEAINYCIMSDKLSKRILFGTDEPFFSQSIALEKYLTTPFAADILRNIFINLINKIL